MCGSLRLSAPRHPNKRRRREMGERGERARALNNKKPSKRRPVLTLITKNCAERLPTALRRSRVGNPALMGATMACFTGAELRRLRAEEECAATSSVIVINPSAIDASHFDFANSLLVGTGGFSTVRAVAKLNLPHDGEVVRNSVVYAVKVMSKRRVVSRANGPQTAYRELNLLKKIMEHPHSRPGRSKVCNLHFAFSDEVSLYLVLDLCWGDLRFHLAKQKAARFAEADVRSYCGQICLALDFLHSAAHILHRDIKV